MDKTSFSDLVIIFPFREVLESACPSSHANPLTVWSKKSTDQPALRALAAGVAVGTGAAAEAERRFGPAGGGEAPPGSHPWREVAYQNTALLRLCVLTHVPWPTTSAEGATEQCRPGFSPAGPLGEKTQVRRLAAGGLQHWRAAGCQPVPAGPACGAILLSARPWLTIRNLTWQSYHQVWSSS